MLTHHIEICARKCDRVMLYCEGAGAEEYHGKDWGRASKQNGDINGGVCVFVRFSDEDSL